MERDPGGAPEEFDEDAADVGDDLPEDRAAEHAAADRQRPGRGRGATARGDSHDGDAEADDDEFEDEDAVGVGPHTEAAAEEDEEEDMRRRRASLIPFVVFLAVVVGLYFVLARALIANRDFADTFVARLPVVGGSMAADRLLFRKVGLSNVSGAYVSIKDAKTLFVISGTASNTASRPLHTIRIEGALLDVDGRELRREETTCGGMITPRILVDLTKRELDLLRKAESPKGYTVPPGESTTFSIVFTDPPPNVAEFTAQVKTARRDT